METALAAGLHVILFFLDALVFLTVLSFIVFFHEYGHFSMARVCGVSVKAFSIGFGKALVRWRDRLGTEWRISAIPVGGYVQFLGDANAASMPDRAVLEDGEPHASDAQPAGDPSAGALTTQFPKPGDTPSGLSEEERQSCLHFKPLWVRALVVAAGPVANFILAIAIFSVMFMAIGERGAYSVVGAVSPGSAAAEAGLLPGDRIDSVNGRHVSTFDDLTYAVRLNAGEELSFGVERGGERLVVAATPHRELIDDGFGNKRAAGVLGVASSPDAIFFQRYGPVSAIAKGTARVGDLLGLTGKYLWRMVHGKEDASQLSGPLGIAQVTAQVADSGFSGTGDAPLSAKLLTSFVNLMQLAAILSVSVGFLNLLPVPVLDGGHLMYYAIEAVTGRPLGAKAQAIGFRVGLALLASFMLFVTWNDLSNGLF